MSAVLDLPRTQTTSLEAIKKAVNLALDEQLSVILSNVDWKTYEDTIKEFNEKQSPRFYYEKGNLLITSNSSEHEDSELKIRYFRTTPMHSNRAIRPKILRLKRRKPRIFWNRTSVAELRGIKPLRKRLKI
jgi:hypothetical protein